MQRKESGRLPNKIGVGSIILLSIHNIIMSRKLETLNKVGSISRQEKGDEDDQSLRPKPEMFDDDFSFVPLNSGSRHNVDQHSLHSKVVLPRYQKKSKKSEQVV